MHKGILFCLVVVLLVCTSAVAADKVVVIPMGGSSPAEPSTPASPLLPVYDGNDSFVGYYLESSKNDILVVSTKGYFTALQTAGSQHSMVFAEIYTTADCSDTPTVFWSAFADNYKLFTGWEGGHVGRNPLDDTPSYIPLNASLVVVDPAYVKQGGCTLIGASVGYNILPNDSAVTGFENTILWPFKVSFDVPQAP